MPDVGSDAYNKISRHWVIQYVNLLSKNVV